MTPSDAESERDTLLIKLAKVQERRDVAIKERDEARVGLAAARKQALAEAKERIDHRMNDYLCEMKEGYDDSITGFNEAWEIISKFFADAIEALASARGEPFDPREEEIGMLKKALSECGQRRLSTEANNRRLREALEEAESWMAGEIGDSDKPRGGRILAKVRAALTQCITEGEEE